MPNIILACKSSGKMVARIENGVLYLWCKKHNTEEAYNEKELLELLRKSKEKKGIA